MRLPQRIGRAGASRRGGSPDRSPGGAELPILAEEQGETPETGWDVPERVAICILTYRRPRGLERLLRSLNRLTFVHVAAPELEVIVVDNDSGGSAASLCAALRPHLRWPLRYQREPRRGVSQARNHALACTLGHADIIAFLDDDETPDPQWLDELLSVQRAYDADAVAGPVVSRFEEPPPAWVVKGGFFEGPRHRTGERLRDCGTGNVVLRAQAVRRMERLFDEALGLTGGEDTDFFVRFTHAGFSLVWAERARVVEWVPPTRVSMRWILQREYRSAITWSRCERILQPGRGARVTRVAKSAIRILQGCLLLPLALGGRQGLTRALLKFARAAGHVVGLLGLHYQEYQVVHGR